MCVIAIAYNGSQVRFVHIQLLYIGELALFLQWYTKYGESPSVSTLVSHKGMDEKEEKENIKGPEINYQKLIILLLDLVFSSHSNSCW